MNYISHSIGGVALGIGVVYVANKLNIDTSPLYLVGGALIGSLLADIDTPHSLVGNKVLIIPSLLYQTVGHRTLTHSLLFAVVVGALISLFKFWLGIGISVGLFSHIILDLLTPGGVAFLYPFNKKRIKLY